MHRDETRSAPPGRQPAGARWRRATILFVLAVLCPALSGIVCPGEVGPTRVEQYHPGAPEPWQSAAYFWDRCRDQLCPKLPCSGTRDEFVIDVPEDPAPGRDRILFLEETPEPAESLVSPFFDPGRVYRAGGRYAFYKGTGRSERRQPLGGLPVGHLRKYVRGVCSVESEALPALRDRLAARVKQRIETHWAITTAELKRKDLTTLLGTDRCGDPSSPHRDVVHLSYRFLVWPLSAGTWSFTLDLWWRFVGHTRDRYLPSATGGSVERLPCTHGDPNEDARCHRRVPGSRCGPWGHCEKPHSLDVADYGVSVRTKSHCHQAAFCDTYLARFRRRWDTVAEHPYQHLFAPLLAELAEELWAPAPDWLAGCRTDHDCRRVHEPLAYESRCVTGADSADPRLGYCELRPVHVYDVNLYPERVELVLARRPTDAGYGLSVLLGQCNPAKRGWTTPSDAWTRSHWTD